jgi:hypothetical protein
MEPDATGTAVDLTADSEFVCRNALALPFPVWERPATS